MWLACFLREETIVHLSILCTIYTWLPQFLLCSIIEYIDHFSFEKLAKHIQHEVDADAPCYSYAGHNIIEE